MIIDSLLVCALLIYSAWADLPFADVVPFALILLVASVPVAGATERGRNGVLVTRLSAVEEAAGIDVACLVVQALVITRIRHTPVKEFRLERSQRELC
jgi:H+-transporting ATPase